MEIIYAVRIVHCFVLIWLLQTFGCSDAASWAYGNGNRGSQHWPAMFPNYCAGKSQSPINIHQIHTVFDRSLTNLTLHDSLNPRSRFEVYNNGHTVAVDVEGNYYISNGGLHSHYKTANIHFHWGKNSLRGSEHQVGGKSAPLEMHIVNWNSDQYSSIDEAMKYPDGLAVLSILFKLSAKDNPKYKTIVKALRRVKNPDEGVKMYIPAVSLEEFLPSSPHRYFRYRGSLTTPSCYESVIWTVFEQRQTISEGQLKEFRQMQLSSSDTSNGLRNLRRKGKPKHDGPALVDNFRPVQDLNGRTVYRSF